jgi:hypothetical protein
MPSYSTATKYIEYLNAILHFLDEESNWTIFTLMTIDTLFTIPLHKFNNRPNFVSYQQEEYEVKLNEPMKYKLAKIEKNAMFNLQYISFDELFSVRF